MTPHTVIAILGQVSVGLGEGIKIQISGTLLFTFLAAITGGIWKCASILSDMRYTLKVGAGRMDKHEERLEDHDKEFIGIREAIGKINGKVGI